MNAAPKNSEQSCAMISTKPSIAVTINEWLTTCMKNNIIDAVLVPMKVPAGDSYVYVLIKDTKLLKDACPLSPIMSMQGAHAISSITRLGEAPLKIAAVMRPCEIRATIELAKQNQTNLEHITLISIDCPGVIPISDFISDPQKGVQTFEKAAAQFDDTPMRPVCQICDKASMIAGDIHIGIHGVKKDHGLMIAVSSKGEELLSTLDKAPQGDRSTWEAAAKKKADEKQKKRATAHKDLQKQTGPIDSFVDTFSHCINCHNCMKVCPICFCRLCFFDSDKVKLGADEYLETAQDKGSIRFLPDTTLFQMGRMMHMSLSCVSCGSCEDACPMSIPVAQVFSMIADQTQGMLGYVAGRSIDEPLPLKTFEKDELHEMEDAHE